MKINESNAQSQDQQNVSMSVAAHSKFEGRSKWAPPDHDGPNNKKKQPEKSRLIRQRIGLSPAPLLVLFLSDTKVSQLSGENKVASRGHTSRLFSARSGALRFPRS